jgi:hypothetical protein
MALAARQKIHTYIGTYLLILHSGTKISKALGPYSKIHHESRFSETSYAWSAGFASFPFLARYEELIDFVSRILYVSEKCAKIFNFDSRS